MYRQLLISLLLLGLGGPALADWVRLARNEQSVIYLETPVPKQSGGHVMVWVLRDHLIMHHGPDGAYVSSKDQLEIDCPARRVRRIYSADFAQPMGQGKQVHYEHGPMSWNFATPNTIISRMMDIACG